MKNKTPYSPDRILLTGDSIGCMKVIRFIGRGAMGEVYEVENRLWKKLALTRIYHGL